MLLHQACRFLYGQFYYIYFHLEIQSFDKEIHLFLPSGRLGKVLPPHTFT